MPNYVWTIEHTGDEGSTYTNITSKVQSWSYRYGRADVTSAWSAGSANMVGWDPSNLPTIKVGDWIKFTAATHGVCYQLAVADFTRVYNPAATADTWEMRLEDAWAEIGRAVAQVGTAGTPNIDLNTVIYTGYLISSGADVNFNVYGLTPRSTCSAIPTTVGQSLGQFIPKLLNQGGAYVQSPQFDGDLNVILWSATAPYGDPSNILTITNFDDDNTLSNGEPYQEIRFEGLADAYFDLVYVQPEGLAAQDAGSGSRVYTTQTYHNTTAQADEWADYLLTQLSSDEPTPSVLTTSTLRWSTVANISPKHLLPANEVKVRLRSTTHDCIIEGGIVSATPEQTRFTLYLSDREVLNYLILDDATYGVLDTDRLGF